MAATLGDEAKAYGPYNSGSMFSGACVLPEKKRCDATKAEFPKLCSASSLGSIYARQTREAIHRESIEAKYPSISYARKEASVPNQVDASTAP